MSGGMSDEQLKERIAWLRNVLADPGKTRYTDEQVEAMRKELEILESWLTTGGDP